MKKYIILIGIVVATYSCNDDMYDNIKEMVNSEKIYLVGYDQAFVAVNARSGEERVEIDLYPGRPSAAEMEKLLPKAKRTVVEYGDTTITMDSVCSWVNITNLIVPNTYRFVIYTENESGDQSIPVEVRQKPFTSADRDALVFTTVASATFEQGAINVSQSPQQYTTYKIRYSYTDKDNVAQSGETDATYVILNNLRPDASTLATVSCYLLPTGAIDTVWVERTVEVKTKSQTAFNDYMNESQMFTDTSTLPRTISAGSSPLFIPAAHFDYGGTGKGWFKNNRYNTNAQAYRSARGDDPNCQVCFDPGFHEYAEYFGGFFGTQARFIGGAQPGDWIAYTLDVLDAGEYQISLQYASGVNESAGSLTVDGLDYFGKFPLPGTNGWGSPGAWKNMVSPVYMTTGRHKIRFTMVDRECGFVGIRLTKI